MPMVSLTATEVELFRKLASVDDVASFLGTSRRRLFFHLYDRKRPCYRSFSIPKASGGHRLISAPPKVLAAFQRRLLLALEAVAPSKPYAHGFTRGRNVRTNAEPHVGSRLVLNFDLLNFFPSIHFGRVLGLFRSHPFNFASPVAAVLAQICCAAKVLPQGAPTSPAISNLICRGIDRDFAALARMHRCRYTRYCDDITISTNRESFPPTIAEASEDGRAVSLGHGILSVLAAHSFQPNDRKTRMRTQRDRQEVTGLVANMKVNVPREFVRNIRSVLHDCERRGVVAADERFRGGIDRKTRRGAPPPLVLHLLGKLAYLRMVRGASDYLYLRLAIRARRALNAGAPVMILGSAAFQPAFLREVIWIVIGRDTRGEPLVEGTAFALHGVGIVSAYHVFTREACVSYELRLSSRPDQVFPVTAIRPHIGHDLVIIEADVPILAALIRQDQMPTHGDPITLAGYPRWLGPPDDLLIALGQVIQPRSAGSTEYIIGTPLIRGGNSGGPLINGDGYVVGVAMYDGSSPIAPNGSVAIRHVNDVIGEPQRAPF
jgi:RNA-directed DNA polymerase